MDIYLVGGAVRDNLLGLTVAERDWVVVGGTPQALEDQGYRRVGKDFPVFLHPRTQEEYALARTERKTGPGYRGFDVYAGEDVTLEEDLQRRDLTINAMAETPEGELIDPWGGCADLEARLLRHVSDAFREDPLRVLRVARFAAKLSPLGFSVAPDTLKLMRDITATGELTTLTPERVWRETEKALRTEHPDVFIATLRACGALEVIFPEVDALYGVPQPEKWHPEVDTGVHIELVLRMSARLTESLPVRLAALVHDLGKGTTDPQWWPSHRDHERRGVDLITQLCARTAVPNHCRDLAIHVARYHTHVHRAAELRPDTYLRVLEQVDAFRRPERCEEFLLACEADARGRTGLEERPYHQAELFRAAHKAATETDRKAIQERGLKGPDFGAALREAQLANISAVLSELRGNLTD